MTENEAIQRLKNRLKTEEQRYGKEFVKEYFDDIDFAISALKEIQQYREIGTVEECRTAVEKQKPKKKIYPQTALEKYYHAPQCPNCKRELTAKICGYTLEQAIGIYSNCPWCGQAINKTVEEIEYEED